MDGLQAINAQYGVFAELRGMGLLLGGALAEAWRGQSGKFVNAALEQGLFLLVAGGDVLRIAPSLLIEDELIAAGLQRLECAIRNVLAGAV